MEMHYALELKSLLRKAMLVTQAEKTILVKDNFIILIYGITPLRSVVKN